MRGSQPSTARALAMSGSPLGVAAIEAVHQVTDVAEGARLRASAEDRHGQAAQGLVEKRGHHAAVIELHARSIGIEDARDIGAQAVLAVTDRPR